MLTLAFDTSTQTASVAVLKDRTVLFDGILNLGLNHSEVLLPLIEQALIQTKIKIEAIDLFACTIGPGSFTGLRIGASTLKGLILGTGKPAVGVSSLAALALNPGECRKTVYSVMDAGRGQVYVACFDFGRNGLPVQIGDNQVLDPSQVIHESGGHAAFVGDGAVKYAQVIRSHAKNKHVDILSSQHQYIRASSVGILGLEKFSGGELLDPDAFVPVYLRSADVQVKKV